MYSKRDLNPHSRCRPRDFKSLVSTIPPFEPQIWVLRAEDGTRIRDPNLGKVVLYQLSYFRNNVNARLVLLLAFASALPRLAVCSSFGDKVALYQLSYFRNNVNARFSSVKAAAKIYAISFLQNEAMKMQG